MCGRYALFTKQLLQEAYDTENALDVPPSWNVSPGQPMPVITRNSPDRIKLMNWGLVPMWAKDIKIGYKMINARAETVREKPAFRSSFKSRRCLVPANGYYEWKKDGNAKQPYYYHLKDRETFSFAGLTAQWHDGNGNELQTYTIITTAANDLAAQVHDRMPVILAKADEDAWLDRLTLPAQAETLLSSYDPDCMDAYPVSPAVGSPRNNVPSLIDPLWAPAETGAAPNSA